MTSHHTAERGGSVVSTRAVFGDPSSVRGRVPRSPGRAPSRGNGRRSPAARDRLARPRSSPSHAVLVVRRDHRTTPKRHAETAPVDRPCSRRSAVRRAQPSRRATRPRSAPRSRPRARLVGADERDGCPARRSAVRATSPPTRAASPGARRSSSRQLAQLTSPSDRRAVGKVNRQTVSFFDTCLERGRALLPRFAIDETPLGVNEVERPVSGEPDRPRSPHGGRQRSPFTGAGAIHGDCRLSRLQLFDLDVDALLRVLQEPALALARAPRGSRRGSRPPSPPACRRRRRAARAEIRSSASSATPASSSRSRRRSWFRREPSAPM